MVIYVDILFFKEFLMNLVILICVGKILSMPMKLVRYIVASSLGGISTIICLSIPISLVGFVRFFTTGMVVVIAYRPRNLKRWMVAMITLYFVTYVIAGISFYTYDQTIKSMVYIVGIMVCLFEFIRMYQEKYRIRNFTYSLEILVNDQKYRFLAFVDTGNSLKSSFGEEVVILSKSVVNRIADKDFKNIMLGHIEDENRYKEKMRWITYESLGNPLGVKYGIKLDKVFLYRKQEVIRKEAVIVMSDSEFAHCDALIGLSFIERSEEEKQFTIQK